MLKNLLFRPTLLAISVDGIMEAIVDWISTVVVKALDLISGQFLNNFNMDMATFVSYFPFATKAFSILQEVGWILLIMMVAFQLLRNFLGPLSDAEKPTSLIGRATISAFGIGFSMQICDILLKLARGSYNVLLKTQATGEDFQWASLSNSLGSLFKTLVVDASVVGLVVKLLLIIAIGWNYIKLLLEVVERYVVLGVLTYTSPLAFTLAGSRSTYNSFKAWCRMYGSQLIMMLMNVWFLRGFNFALAGFLSNFGSVAPSNTSEAQSMAAPMLFWLFAVLAFLRTAQAIDRHLSALGLSVAQTGIGLGQELMHTGMSLAMGARMMTMGMGRGASSTGGGASSMFGRLSNKMNAGSYALDAARVNATTAMGGNGFISNALRNSAAQKLANGTTMLTPNQIGMVANAMPKAGMGNIIDGGQLGNIGTSSLKSFMPQLNGANIQGTNIGAGKITTSAVGADGNATSLTLLNASQTGAMPNGAVRMTAADGSQWYMMASGSGAGEFSNAAAISPEGESIGNRFSGAGFSPDATVQNIGDGAIRVTDSNGTSDWVSTMNHDVGDISGRYMTADNGEVFFSQTPIADTSSYIGSPDKLVSDFGSAFNGRDITNVQAAGEGQFEFYDKNSQSWYRASDANYYEQPQNATSITDNNGNQYFVEQATERNTNVPVNDENGNPIMQTIKDETGTRQIPKTEVQVTRSYGNLRSKRGFKHK